MTTSPLLVVLLLPSAKRLRYFLIARFFEPKVKRQKLFTLTFSLLWILSGLLQETSFPKFLCSLVAHGGMAEEFEFGLFVRKFCGSGFNVRLPRFCRFFRFLLLHMSPSPSKYSPSGTDRCTESSWSTAPSLSCYENRTSTTFL